MQTFVTVFDILWLCAVLVFLWLIWHTSSRQTQQMQKTLIDLALTSAESAKQSAEAARHIAEVLERKHV